jgi:hypothetical protein
MSSLFEARQSQTTRIRKTETSVQTLQLIQGLRLDKLNLMNETYADERKAWRVLLLSHLKATQPNQTYLCWKEGIDVCSAGRRCVVQWEGHSDSPHVDPPALLLLDIGRHPPGPLAENIGGGGGVGSLKLEHRQGGVGGTVLCHANTARTGARSHMLPLAKDNVLYA